MNEKEEKGLLDQEVFRKKRVRLEKLEAAGFVYSEGQYLYHEQILDGDFEVRVQIDEKGQVSSQVIDMDLEEEYRAVQVPTARGSFVGQVREAYLAVLENLATTCFEALPFAKDQTNRLARKIEREWGDPYDRPFDKYGDIVSYRIGGKWYALILPLKLGQLGVTGSEAEKAVEVVNLKVDPADMEGLLALPGVYPSYHMSKKSWISLVLEGALPDEKVWELVARSRHLANPNPLANDAGPDFWVIPANPKVYDIDAEFAETKVVYWTQKGKIKKGDLVAMYITAPVQAIRYVCRCLEAEIDNTLFPDEPHVKKLMKVELLAQFSDETFPRERMMALGVRAVRGPRRMTKELREAVGQELRSRSDSK